MSQRNSSVDLASFLPCHSTHIQDLLAPITTVKYLPFPGGLHLSGNEGSFSIHSYKAPHNPHKVLDLFATGTVRELHLPVDYQDISPALGRLPTLEALVIYDGHLSPNSLSILAKEPVLCLSLKTIAFLDCGITPDAVNVLERILAKRERSTAAWLHRVVIVNHARGLPKNYSISQLQRLVPRVNVAAGDKLPDLL